MRKRKRKKCTSSIRPYPAQPVLNPPWDCHERSERRAKNDPASALSHSARRTM
jgi:hypothetical protein